MNKTKKNLFLLSAALISLMIFVPSCKEGDSVDETGTTAAETPTPTEAPMAVRVNDEGILLSDYEAEIQRYRKAVEELGQPLDEAQAKEDVLRYLTDQKILAQAAYAQGFIVEENLIDARMKKFVDDIGSQEALNEWVSTNLFSPDQFRAAVIQDIAAMWMRDQFLSTVPVTAEQVHARQVLVRTQNEAIAVERQLQAGTSFNTLAFEYDPISGGDLGWFPRGYLLQPAVEEAAFNLTAGSYSGIIETSYGFHLVYVIERDAAHPLSPDALLFVQKASFAEWLAERRASSQIEILVP